MGLGDAEGTPPSRANQFREIVKHWAFICKPANPKSSLQPPPPLHFTLWPQSPALITRVRYQTTKDSLCCRANFPRACRKQNKDSWRFPCPLRLLADPSISPCGPEWPLVSKHVWILKKYLLYSWQSFLCLHVLPYLMKTNLNILNAVFYFTHSHLTTGLIPKWTRLLLNISVPVSSSTGQSVARWSTGRA